jgi:cytochrome c-type biogenesis protein CcmH/NrfF
MDTIIAAPASCEIRAVIRFLNAEGQSTAEIHRRLCRVYGDNIMSGS